MKGEEIRLEMNRYWHQVDREALEFKDPQIALDRLHTLYRRLDAHERAVANEVLTEWVLSDHEPKRFDAMALISDFRIAESLPSLHELISRLEQSSDPGAPFERNKAERIIVELSQNGPHSERA